MIFWKYIKGLNGTQYTWLEFLSSSGRPTIKTNSTNNLINATDWGSIVTTKGVDAQIIETALKLNSTLSVLTTGSTYINVFKYANSQLEIGQSGTKVYIPTTFNVLGAATFSSTLGVSGAVTFSSTLNSGKITTTEIKSNGKVEATYFNTTSDARAKEDVTLYNGDALDIVKAVQIHTFRYKDSKKPSLGMIAQDLVDYKFGDFSLVDNQGASGENGDYMTIHESKLVYILWKAVQEQQELIENLYEKINQLKKEA